MCANYSNPTVVNCEFIRNSATKHAGGFGGAISCNLSSPIFQNCTFTANEAVFAGKGGAVYCENGSGPSFVNCILWGNKALGGGHEIWATPSSGDNVSIVTLEYSDVQREEDAYGVEGVGGDGLVYWGTGMIDADPLFVDPASNNVRLAPDSPCMNAGDNVGAAVTADQETTAAGSTDTLIVADAGQYSIGDKIIYDYNRDCNRIERTLIAVDVTANMVIFEPPLPADSQTGKIVRNYGRGDLDGQDRVMCRQVDMGAYEVVCQAGDVNRDGTVAMSDAVTLLQYLHEGKYLSRAQLFAADVSGNGCISQKDANDIISYVFPPNAPFAVEQMCDDRNEVPGQGDFKLTVIPDSDGDVSVSPDPPCRCYQEGTVVVLTAQPHENASFKYWYGDVPEGHEKDFPQLRIVMNSDKTIGADFPCGSCGSASAMGLMVPLLAIALIGLKLSVMRRRC